MKSMYGTRGRYLVLRTEAGQGTLELEMTESGSGTRCKEKIGPHDEN